MPKDPKSTQRERLLDAMIHVAAREGYASATIAHVIEHAGVSRPTFYDYFTDKDDCFLAAVAVVQRRLLDHIRRAVERAEPQRAIVASVRAMVEFANELPERANFLTNAPLAGGARALDARDRGIAQIAQIVDRVEQAREAATPDVASRLLIGATQRLLASRLRRGESGMDGVLEDLTPWIESYAMPSAEQRWRALVPMPSPDPWPLPPEMLLRAPAPLSPRRGRAPEEAVENQRQRILFATAEIVEEEGYTAATIAAITKRAGVDYRTFSSLFADKRDAFMTIYELGFQRTMAVTASAFAAGATWPGRVWEAGRALTHFLHLNPTIAHIRLVDAPAVGPGGGERVDESIAAFTIFLHEGNRSTSRAARGTSTLALHAIATTVYELCYHESRHDRCRQVAMLLPHVTFLCLAPFLGPAEANKFIDEHLAASAYG